MPFHRRLHDGVREVQFRLRQRGFGLLHMGLSRRGTRTHGRYLFRRSLCALQCGSRLLFASRCLNLPALRHSDSGFRLGDLRAHGVRRGFRRVRGRNRCIELLLRHLILGEESTQTLDVARRSRRVRFRFAKPRLSGDETRARHIDFTRRRLGAASRLLDRALRRTDVARRGRRRDRHVALRGDGGGFRIGQFRPRLVDRDLIIARVDLDEHGAGFDDLIVLDRHFHHRAADARRHRNHVRIHLRIVG